MSRCIAPCLLIIALATSALAIPAVVTGRRPFATTNDATQLFNGKDLTNFYTWLVDSHYDDPAQVFSVVDAIDGTPAIRVSGKHLGGFITKEEYSNYHLVTEWR